jgi:hypothetical protein
VVVNLGDRGDAGSCVLQGIPDIFRLRVASLHAEQAYNRRQSVLDAVAHLARQHGLVVEGFLKVRVGMLPLDGDAEQPREAGQEIGIVRDPGCRLPARRTADGLRRLLRLGR